MGMVDPSSPNKWQLNGGCSITGMLIVTKEIDARSLGIELSA